MEDDLSGFRRVIKVMELRSTLVAIDIIFVKKMGNCLMFKVKSLLFTTTVVDHSMWVIALQELPLTKNRFN